MDNAKIDLLLPYVNNQDADWQKKFIEEKRKLYREGNGVRDCRFRDYGSLRLLFRSIETNMSWINNIFLVLSSPSQIPEWLNVENPKLKIIYHKEIIPNCFLPVFNSSAIEMFYSNIKGISEKIIYANDDMYAMKPLFISDFFTNEGLPKIYWKKCTNPKNDFLGMEKREFELLKSKYSFNKEYWVRPDHLFCPMLKSNIDYIYKTYNLEILNSITKFRENKSNMQQYIYTQNQVLSGNYERLNTPLGITFTIKEGIEIESLKEIIQNNRVVCVNDHKSAKENDMIESINILSSIFKSKSSFEI